MDKKFRKINPVPFVDFTRHHKHHKREYLQAIQSVFNKGQFILSENVQAFEEEFATYLSSRYAIGVASGTDAIRLALAALDLQQKDEVILPANAYPTAFAVAQAGVRIRLADIDPQSHTLDPHSIERAITQATKVIIPVHLYGLACDMQRLSVIAKRNKIHIIEDAAQAHGALYKGKKVGTLGTIGCFSFYPTKNLGAYGDGGMIVTNKKRIAKTTRMLRNYGEVTRYKSLLLGFNSRLDELHAAILRVKLSYLDEQNQKRQILATLYHKLLKDTSVILPFLRTDNSHVYHLFVIRCKKRNKVRKILSDQGVQTAIHYPTPIHLVPSFKFLGYKKGDFPNAEQAASEILSLPLYPELSKRHVEAICHLVKKAVE